MKPLIMSLLTILCSLFGCKSATTMTENDTTQTPSFKSVQVEEFAKIIADTTVIRLDVRTTEEYAEGHIENALNIDVLKDDFASKATATLPKDRTIALYCRSGKRSKRAAGILAADGYHVIDLDTGYLGWTGAGQKVVK